MSNKVEPAIEDELELLELGDAEILLLGRAEEETKQVWIGPHPDSQYGHGYFPGL